MPAEASRTTGVDTFAAFSELPDDLGRLGVDLGRTIGLEQLEPVGAGHHGLIVMDHDDQRVAASGVLGSVVH